MASALMAPCRHAACMPRPLRHTRRSRVPDCCVDDVKESDMPDKPPLALVVEDDEPLRALLTDVLAGEGYSILQARDGEEAMQLLDEVILPANVPCVMLLDMMLPDVSGVGVLDHLRA